MGRADRNDYDLSSLLADRRQGAQLGPPRFAAIVDTLVDLLHRLAYQYAVNGPAKLAMIMRLAAGGGALMRRADAEEVVRIAVESPGAVAVLIHWLAVGDAFSGQHPRQRVFDVIERSGVGEKPFQRFFCPLKDSPNRGLGFECGAGLGDKFFNRIVCLIHNSGSSDALLKVCRGGEGSQMVDDMKRDSMGFLGKRGATVLQHDHPKVRVGGMSHGRLDDKFSGHAH